MKGEERLIVIGRDDDDNDLFRSGRRLLRQLPRPPPVE